MTNLARKSWFVVHTKPRSEECAATFLHDRAVPTFLPRLLVNKRHGSRRWQALEPLFPGYLFAHFQPEPMVISRVRWALGVKRLLSDGEAPIPVPDDVIAYLRERMGDRGYITPDLGLAPGTRVRFTSGPFALLEGIIVSPPSRAQRVRVLLHILNAGVSIEADADLLERT